MQMHPAEGFHELVIHAGLLGMQARSGSEVDSLLKASAGLDADGTHEYQEVCHPYVCHLCTHIVNDIDANFIGQHSAPQEFGDADRIASNLPSWLLWDVLFPQLGDPPRDCRSKESLRLKQVRLQQQPTDGDRLGSLPGPSSTAASVKIQVTLLRGSECKRFVVGQTCQHKL
eukprot:5911083-Amphidinium_carterae.1